MMRPAPQAGCFISGLRLSKSVLAIRPSRACEVNQVDHAEQIGLSWSMLWIALTFACAAVLIIAVLVFLIVFGSGNRA